jgi:hypothetical protein
MVVPGEPRRQAPDLEDDMTRGRIVVFGDHTPAAVQALRWAVEEADRRGSTVCVVRPFDAHARADLALEGDLVRARRDSRYRTQSWVIEAVSDLDTAVPVSVWTPDGTAADALADCAKDAELVVIGDADGTAELLASRVRELCTCPVQVGIPRPTVV